VQVESENSYSGLTYASVNVNAFNTDTVKTSFDGVSHNRDGSNACPNPKRFGVNSEERLFVKLADVSAEGKLNVEVLKYVFAIPMKDVEQYVTASSGCTVSLMIYVETYPTDSESQDKTLAKAFAASSYEGEASIIKCSGGLGYFQVVDFELCGHTICNAAQEYP